MSTKSDSLIADIDNKFEAEINNNPQSATISDKSQSPQTANNNRQDLDSNKTKNDIKQTDHQSKQVGKIEDSQDCNSSPLQNTTVKKKIGQSKVNFQNLNQNVSHSSYVQESSYRSLTNNLQTALKKLNTQKNQSNRLNKNKTMNLLLRFEDHERKKQREIEEKRLAEEEKKYLGLKPKPDINPKSRKIAQQTSHKPIYERFEKILEDKKKKFEQNQQDKKAKQEQEFDKFKTQYESQLKLQPQDCRNCETFFQDMVTWKKKLQKQKQQKHKLKQQKQLEGITFKPELNKKSMKMAERVKRVPIQERQTARNYRQEPGYSFQPKTFKKRNI